METLISPSLLSANFINLKKDIEMINNSEADWLHLDIMDGVFVPNISFGFPVIEAVAKECKKPLDVHLMIVHPENYIKQVAATGAMMMNVHYEACTHLHRTVQEIHAAGMKAGVTLNPHTPVSMLEDIICDVDMVLRESNVTYFAGLNGIPSEQFGIKHTFTLRGVGDRWLIVRHWSDDNAYYSADYDRTTHQDKNFPAITDYIEARRDLPREGLSVTAAADHPYDREAAWAYMLTWVGKRNPAFMAYDDYGGNCMNFGSQVLAAGGIPMDTNGGYETGWYWYSASQTTLPWVNVGWFLEYAAAEREHGLVAVVNAPYFTGETGDIITMGVEEPANHTTVILDTIKDENGVVVDYLLCSNTADLRNFPASAYYYTNRQLTKIIGWND